MSHFWESVSILLDLGDSEVAEKSTSVNINRQAAQNCGHVDF